ncbi:hypothetical protein AB0K52_21050 [Glycomyces sp. NPDC049804]|uniref:hypothetical protein n=1 Tax=Glycomyces sp. NPDC049804 TaxID=3154363 RepID=UPI0034305CB6
MEHHDHTERLLLQGRPDDPAPPSAVDIKQVMSRGYRAQARRNAAIGGASAAGVAAIAAVLALSLTGLGDDGRAPDAAQTFPPGEPFDFDPATAAYPPAHPLYETADPVGRELNTAAKEAFGELAVDAGIFDADALDYEFPSDEAALEAMEEHRLDYYSALSELGFNQEQFNFEPRSLDAKGGQASLRAYFALDSDEEAEHLAYRIAGFQPGGWTAEPGPTGDVAFPQHLISDEAVWTDEAPEFATETLDDGRVLMTADHGCALEAAVVYPNGSALTSWWDLDCHGHGREMSLEDLSAAMLAMPQIDYDTSELAPVEFLDMPPAWPVDESWPQAADADAQASLDAAVAVIEGVYGETEHNDGSAVGLHTGSGEVVQRTYTADVTMPFNDGLDTPISLNVRYYLPGGWLPGLPPEGAGTGPYLIDCGAPGDDKDDQCAQSELDGRTVATRTWCIGDEHCSWFIGVFDESGWAVVIETGVDGGTVEGYGLEALTELATALPAPVYDPADYGTD